MTKPTPAEILAARLTAKLTQKKAAEQIGYSRRSWQEWEGGRRNMRLVTFQAFQRAVVGRS